MNHIKLFEDFDQDSNMGPDYYDLTNGKKVFFWEEPFGDMAGETNYMIKYKIGKSLDDCQDATYKEVEPLLKPEDKKEHEQYKNNLGDDNAGRSKDWVK